jgi:Ca2+-binding RTX toxin-like protein
MTVTKSASSDDYLVEDSAGVQAGGKCTQASRTAARCPIGGTMLRLSIKTGDGDDVVDLSRAEALASEVDAGAGNDRVQGTYLYNRLFGGPGNDTLKGGSHSQSQDLLNGGDGDDELRGSPGGDTLIGGVGADRLSGGDGWDRLGGGAGADWLLGGGGSDTLIANDSASDHEIDCGGEEFDYAAIDESLDASATRGCPADEPAI